MTPKTILDAGLRDDLAQCHQDTFNDLSQPGDWLTAAERIALVHVVRAARVGADQPPWYRPSADQSFAPLADAATDAAWRLTNHPGTLTADWYTETVADLPSAEYYVELVGVVAVVNAVDRLATILDVAFMPVPEPARGEPARPTIPSSVTTHWVPTAHDDDSGAMVLLASSVAPGVVEMRTRIGATHYMSRSGMADMDYSRGTLDRRQIEVVAGVTSIHNECFY